VFRYAPSYDQLDGGAASSALGFPELRQQLLQQVSQHSSSSWQAEGWYDLASMSCSSCHCRQPGHLKFTGCGIAVMKEPAACNWNV